MIGPFPPSWKLRFLLRSRSPLEASFSFSSTLSVSIHPFLISPFGEALPLALVFRSFRFCSSSVSFSEAKFFSFPAVPFPSPAPSGPKADLYRACPPSAGDVSIYPWRPPPPPLSQQNSSTGHKSFISPFSLLISICIVLIFFPTSVAASAIFPLYLKHPISPLHSLSPSSVIGCLRASLVTYRPSVLRDAVP